MMMMMMVMMMFDEDEDDDDSDDDDVDDDLIFNCTPYVPHHDTYSDYRLPYRRSSGS